MRNQMLFGNASVELAAAGTHIMCAVIRAASRIGREKGNEENKASKDVLVDDNHTARECMW